MVAVMSESAALKPDERRRFERIALPRRVQFLVGGTDPHEGVMVDISLGGAAIHSEFRPSIGDLVTSYVDKVARLEGRVVRYIANGFAIQFEMGERKRERLNEAIRRALHPETDEPGAEKRKHVRVGSLDGGCVVETEDGVTLSCRVKDLSIVGASVETDQRLPIGALVKVGSALARVVRHTPYGFAVEFKDYWRSVAVDDS